MFRSYAQAQLQNLPSCLKECWDLLSSEAFFLLLSNLTGLRLHAFAAGDDESDGEGQAGRSEGRSDGRDGRSEGQEGRSEGQAVQSEGRDGRSEGRSEARDGRSDTNPVENERNDADGPGPSSASSITEEKNEGEFLSPSIRSFFSHML